MIAFYVMPLYLATNTLGVKINNIMKNFINIINEDTSPTFSRWLDTLVSEKGIDPEVIMEIEGPSGTNYMPIKIVLDGIKNTGAREQEAIRNMLVKIDFNNGDVVHYFKHLAKALAQ